MYSLSVTEAITLTYLIFDSDGDVKETQSVGFDVVSRTIEALGICAACQ
ncbi:MAG: hypothetical protein ABJK37_21500 [Paraglaciecola sp.]